MQRSTGMLMCGEDLGFVPACVPPVMRELGIIGLRIQRMPGFDSPDGARRIVACMLCGRCAELQVRVHALLHQLGGFKGKMSPRRAPALRCKLCRAARRAGKPPL